MCIYHCLAVRTFVQSMSSSGGKKLHIFLKKAAADPSKDNNIGKVYNIILKSLR